ncbi:hypothetical protein AUK40_04865 [Candidatus Wirthbacteria bacterium CG2_30_54_11]|uniref:DUF2029 domain-containing protein n=1 Tax=Candidatus Wirthbacteria bacterium CG2_30_54_11 TaxID=1817892 RepID=A0A1J5IZ39_9BACT|nr:MAG: hypothetical protein AUK40_04865 [Candidatus Wirthbacteria bacterium CG2_30_54_11]
MQTDADQTVELKRNRLQIMTLISLVGFLLAVVVYYIRAYYQGLSYPQSTFLFFPGDRFNDFFNIAKVTKNLDPYFEFGGAFGNYFPLAYLFVYPFSLIADQWQALYWFTVVFCLLFCGFLFFHFVLRQAGTHRIDLFTWFPIVTMLVSYPVLFTVDRGNIELYVFGCCALFLLLFQKKQYTAASICLAAAISMKLYPAVFLIFLLSEKKYRQSIIVCLATAVLSVGALLLFRGTITSNLEGLKHGLDWYTTSYVKNFNILEGINYNESYFSVFRILSVLGYLKISLGQLLTPYLIATMVGFALVTGYVIWVEKEIWKQVMLLVGSMILLPYVSADYKLIHLFLPIALFVASPSRSRLDGMYAVIFGLLVIPKTYFTTPEGINWNSLINILLMTVLCGLIILDRFVLSRRQTASIKTGEDEP